MRRPKRHRDEMLLRLIEARKAAGLTQADAAEATGMLRQTVNSIEAGRKRFMVPEMVAFCRLYGVTPNWMMGFVPHPRGGDDG